MRRADRLLQIVQALRGGRRVTAQQLAEKLEVSARTIYRDVADLIGNGVPIDGEAGFGYIMQDGYDLPPLMFTHEEIVALVAGARMIRAWGGLDMADAAEEALVKIEAVLPEKTRTRADNVQIHAFKMPAMDDETRARLDRIEAAIEGHERLRATYSDAAGIESVRPLCPLGLWFWGQTWTLVAWCELRDDFRMFRVDRFTKIEGDGLFRPRRGRTLADFRECEQAKSRAPS